MNKEGLYKVILEFFGSDYERQAIQVDFIVTMPEHYTATENLVKAKISWLWMVMDPDVKYRIVDIEKV